MTICKVGYSQESKKFFLQFKSASQKGVRSPILEEKTDWVAVMRLLLVSLDNNPTDTAAAPVPAPATDRAALRTSSGSRTSLRILRPSSSMR